MVQGLDKLNRRWAAIPDRVRMNVRYEMEEQAEKIVADMYRLAPHLTGDLAGSIQWTWGEAPEGSMTIGQVGGGAKYGAMRITIYAGGGEAFYARFQEFGTVNMPANPFFFPVWRLNKRRLRSAVSRAVSKAIKQA